MITLTCQTHPKFEHNANHHSYNLSLPKPKFFKHHQRLDNITGEGSNPITLPLPPLKEKEEKQVDYQFYVTRNRGMKIMLESF